MLILLFLTDKQVLENGEDATVVTLSELLKEADVSATT
jgi:ribosome-associated protein YbcJ (S4-like RNA binding protein)